MDRVESLYAKQFSVGETGAPVYDMKSVREMQQNPVTAKLSEMLYKHTGLRLVTANMADGIQGFYDRNMGALVVSNKIGAGELLRQVVSHELTHFIERSPGYAKYKDAVIASAYKGDTDAFNRDKADTIALYKGKVNQELNEENAESEVIAAATMKLIDAANGAEVLASGSENLIYSLLGEKSTLPQRLIGKLSAFLSSRKAMKDGTIQNYREIQSALDALKDAIANRGKWTETDADMSRDATGMLQDAYRETEGDRLEKAGEQTRMQFAIDYDKQNRPFVSVEEDVLDGVPKSEWAKTVKDVLREKFPNGIEVGNNLFKITKAARNEITNSKDTKWLRWNDEQAYSDKMRAAVNADEILRASRDYVNESPEHERNDRIVEFARGNVQLEVGGNGYSAEVIVARKDDGSLVLYDFVNMQKADITKKTQRTAGPQSAPHSRHAVSLSTDSVQQNDSPVKPQYAVGKRQFGNVTAQGLDILADEAKAYLLGSEYEKDVNAVQVERATSRESARILLLHLLCVGALTS